MNKGGELLTVSGAARILTLSSDRVREFADAGVLPCMRTTTGVRLFERAAVEALAARRAEALQTR